MIPLFVTRIRKRNKLTPFMPRKPLYEELSGAVGCFCRQAGGEAVPLPAPVHNRAAGGSLSSGPWNKCLACGWGFDIFVIFHFRHERRKHSSAFVTKIFRSAVYNFRTKILRQKIWLPRTDSQSTGAVCHLETIVISTPSYRSDSPASSRWESHSELFWDF